MKEKALKYLAILGGVFGAIAAIDAIPFIEQEWGIFIIGLSASLAALITKIGDFVDDGKLNSSFGSSDDKGSTNGDS